MSRYVSPSLRSEIAERAGHRCEYCHISSRHSFLPFHIEHIVSIKHGGQTNLQNLAWACPICNCNKGTDIATFLGEKDDPIRFFNPRKDVWADHFEADESGFLIAKTPIGQATVKMLDLNHPESITERREMIRFGIF